MDLLAYSEVEKVLLDLVGDDVPETYRQLGPEDSQRRRLAILRGKAIEHLVNAAAEAFIEQPANSFCSMSSLATCEATIAWSKPGGSPSRGGGKAR